MENGDALKTHMKERPTKYFAKIVNCVSNTVKRYAFDLNSQDELFKLIIWEEMTKESKLAHAGL